MKTQVYKSTLTSTLSARSQASENWESFRVVLFRYKIALLAAVFVALASCNSSSGGGSPNNPSNSSLAAPVATATAGDSSVTLQWQAVADAQYYALYSGTDGTDGTLEKTTDATDYTFRDLDNGTQYSFQLTAVNADGRASDKSESVTATPVATPVVQVVASDCKNRVTLSWAQAAGATEYIVLQNDATIVTIQDTTYTVTGDANSEHTYSVRAINANGASDTDTHTVTIPDNSDAELTKLVLEVNQSFLDVELAQEECTGNVVLPYGADLTNDIIITDLSSDKTVDILPDKHDRVMLDNNNRFTLTLTKDGATKIYTINTSVREPEIMLTANEHSDDAYRIGAGDFSKNGLFTISGLDNSRLGRGVWNYSITITGTDKSMDTPALELQFDSKEGEIVNGNKMTVNPLTPAQWSMFRESNGDSHRLTVEITLSRSRASEESRVAPPDWNSRLVGIAKEQYLLKNWQDVQGIEHDLSGDYTLLHDITFPDSEQWSFKPLGEAHITITGDYTTDGTFFTGTINGNHKQLHNLRIHEYSDNIVGLIRVLGTGGSVRNLGLVNVQVTGATLVGSLAGVSKGSIIGSYATGSVTGGGTHVGGLVGENYGGSISESYSTCTVNGQGTYIGGLAGRSVANGMIHNTYATGNVHGGSEVGGLLGCTNSGIISKSYSTGVVSGGTKKHIGGFMGLNNLGIGGGRILHSYWDTTVNSDRTSDGGTGKTTDEMQELATFDAQGDNSSDWDFTTIWCINEGRDYPRLREVGGQDLQDCQ